MYLYARDFDFSEATSLPLSCMHTIRAAIEPFCLGLRQGLTQNGIILLLMGRIPGWDENDISKMEKSLRDALRRDFIVLWC